MRLLFKAISLLKIRQQILQAKGKPKIHNRLDILCRFLGLYIFKTWVLQLTVVDFFSKTMSASQNFYFLQ